MVVATEIRIGKYLIKNYNIFQFEFFFATFCVKKQSYHIKLKYYFANNISTIKQTNDNKLPNR